MARPPIGYAIIYYVKVNKRDGMSEEIGICEQIMIRDAGKDECWLQHQIWTNPSCLGLGELEQVGKEKKQSSGGRLDILLGSPEDDSRYAVEVMLGETDETHIIRTIEYWLRERRRHPTKQHYAVIVAEKINKRFFEVIYLLSETTPIIAIQANLRKIGGVVGLSFDTILDIYEDPADESLNGGDSSPAETLNNWQKKAAWTVSHADLLKTTLSNVMGEIAVNYVQSYISLSLQGKIFMRLHKRAGSSSLLGFRAQSGRTDELAALLDDNQIPYTRKGPRSFKLTINNQFLSQNQNALIEIAKYIGESSTEE
jgi:hypothetical protein